MAYAKGTAVSAGQSENEIKATLRRYGATSFASFESETHAMVAFEIEGRRIIFKLPLPDRTDREFTHRRVNASSFAPRAPADVLRVWSQACNERWRALLLCIKAKLESVESGIETFEDAFLAHIQLPDGHTVSEHVRPGIATAYKTGNMPPLLPGPSSN